MNCRTHEHRHFERILRSTDIIPGPRLAEGRFIITRLLVLRQANAERSLRGPTVRRRSKRLASVERSDCTRAQRSVSALLSDVRLELDVSDVRLLAVVVVVVEVVIPCAPPER